MVSSQKFVPVEDIKNDLVLLKDGSVSLIIVTSAVNFGLLFETEQMAIIEAFAGLLNSLSFPIQIVVYSKRMDVTSYLKTLEDAAGKQSNSLLQKVTLSYRAFVEGLIKEKNVLDKQFYVCLSVTSLELGIGFKNKDDKLKKALTILFPRRDHMLRQLGHLGLKAKQLNTVELIKLFYDWYNPPVISMSENTQAVPETKAPVVPIPAQPESVPAQPIASQPQPEPPVQSTPPVMPPSPQPVQFTPPPNTQIRMQPSPTPPPPTDLPQLATMPASIPRPNTPFVVEELKDD